MSGIIDWSKAPAEEKQRAIAVIANDLDRIDRKYTASIGVKNGMKVEAYFSTATALYDAGYRKQVQQWTGESLPPVGTVCESLWSSTEGSYVQVKVLAHDEDRAVFRIMSGERKGEYGSDLQHTRFGEQLPIFRPIRTAEQIAEDKRLHQIRNALTAINSEIEKWNVSTDCSVAMRATVEAMIDAGYTKP